MNIKNMSDLKMNLEEPQKKHNAQYISYFRVLISISYRCIKSVVRPAMLYGMETVAVTERQAGKMEVAELEMVRWALGVTRKDKIRNEYVRGTAKIAKLVD